MGETGEMIRKQSVILFKRWQRHLHWTCGQK